MCSTGSKTSENKGGGSDPLWKISIKKLLFFCWRLPLMVHFQAKWGFGTHVVRTTLVDRNLRTVKPK